MQVQQLPLYQFLEGNGKSFVIPVYQRDYAWTKLNCQKLWEDLLDLHQNTREDHFLGTIVTIGSGFQEYLIIDGQQRLTTASILLIALHNYLKSQATENPLQEQVLDFLINRYAQNEKRIRLKPNKQDKLNFEKLFEYDENIDNTSNIINNYNFFTDKINAKEISPQQLFDVFRKLKIVLIDLIRGQDDPQLIFESLNSTGVDLTAGDLIRNYILMDLEPVEQESMYSKYWVEIEKHSGDVAEFIRNYLIYKTRTSIKKDAVYNTFKQVAIDSFNADKVSILQELLTYAEIYSWFVQNNTHTNSKINTGLKRIKDLEFTVCYPYLFDVFTDLKEANVNEDSVSQVLKIIESYAFRKILVDNTTQGLNKLFISLAKDIKKEGSWKEEYINILSYILLEKRVSQRFPNNEEFENALINKEIYRLQSKNRDFLLESLENFNPAYPVNIDELTVEHIMPQTLTKDWKTKLGENWQEIHNKYLHTLGNLTFTAKNTELSNNSIEDKQRIDFQMSKLQLNSKIDKTIWNEEKIVERAKDLIKNAKDIWSYPKTTYSKPIPEEQLFDLTSEDSFSGSKLSHLFFEEDEKGIELKNWRDMLTKTCKFLYEYSPTQFNEIQASSEFKWYFNKEKPLRHSLEFRPKEFIEGNISANGIISFLRKICERLNYQPENIQFSIKDIKE